MMQNWESFWERIAFGIDAARAGDLPEDGPEADLVRYAIAQHEPAMPRGTVWNIEVLV